MPKLSFIRNMSSLVREGVLDGKDYLICPVVLIKEGVWNGLYYPAEELAKFPEAWNGREVPVYHPLDLEGDSVSASDPQVIEQYSIGRLFKVHWDAKAKSLKGEVWVDVEKAGALENGKKLLEKLEANEMVEVSTGLFVEILKQPGEFGGVAYEGTAINHRPDHLALLPEAEGACSVTDGAGLPRINQGKSGKAAKGLSFLQRAVHSLSQLFKGNEDNSLDKRWNELRDMITRRYNPGPDGWLWIEDMREETVIFVVEADNTTRHYQIGYSVSEDGEATLSEDEAAEVEPVTQYQPVGNSAGGDTEEGDDGMDREKTITELISNRTWEEEDREFLNGLDDARLGQVAALVPVPAPKTNEGEAVPKTAPVVPKTNEVEAPAPVVPKSGVEGLEQTAPGSISVEQFLSQAPDEVRQVLNGAMAIRTKQRKTMVDALVGNARCQFTREQLDGMDDSTLRNMVSLAQVQVSFEANDTGDGAPTPMIDDSRPEPMPVLNWNKDGAIEDAPKE